MGDDVKRYAMELDHTYETTNYGDERFACVTPEDDPHGDWVRFDDYEALRQRCERLEAEMQDFATFGVRADTNPTDGGQMGRTSGEVNDWFCRYLGDIDQSVRERARLVLNAAKEPTDG